ncbi:MAG: hypothetical protein LBQ93_04360 [Treponema sp.]|jgi:hypothetical protein|nr:hypothetical protein [Treponema sp.]
MKNNETLEMLLTRVYNSVKIKKLLIILVLAGIMICFAFLLPPVQNALFSFVDARTSGVNMKTSGTFDSRLKSLLSLPFFGLVIFVLAFCCLFSKTIAAFLEDIKNAKLISVFTAGAAVLLLGFISVFSYQHGWQWLNSDNASEMVLGKLLADENVFVSRNWHYSTEIRLIYQTMFTMPLFKLLGHYENWALIRALNILLNNLVLILSYFFMTRQMKIQLKQIVLTSFFLIIPVSIDYWDIVTFGGYYIFFIAQLFCCLGLFIKLANNTNSTKTVLIDFILFTALSFALGIQGIRLLLCVHIPLFIACVYLYSKDARKKSFHLFLGCYGLVVCCIGFAANYLLHFWYSFHSFDNMRLENLFDQFLPKLGQSLVCLAGFFGFSAGSSLLSAHGLFSVIAITGTFLLLRAVFKSFSQFRLQDDTTDKQTEYQFMPVFFIVSVIFNIFIFIIVDEDITDRYFIPFMVLYIPLIAMYFQYTETRYSHLKRTTIISGIVLFIFGQSYLNFQNMTGKDINTARKGYIQYLMDNRLGYGFATFWNANITTELSNGKIELAGLEPWGLNPDTNYRFHIQGWLNPVKFYNPSYSPGESFLLLTRAEWELAQATGRLFTQLQPDYEDSGFIVIRYPSAETIHREVLDN